MKIVNKFKFIRMLTLILIISALLIFSNKCFSKGEIKTKTIYVCNGDTLWQIASNEKENNLYYEDKDIRDIIYEIKKLNNLENNFNLSIGQKIIVNELY